MIPDRRDGTWVPTDKPRNPWPRRMVVSPYTRPYRLDTADWERMP